MALPKGQLIDGKARASAQLTASSTWAKSGGFFCKLDANGYATQASGSDTYISGWIDIGFDPSDSNISSDVLTVPSTTTEKYRFPFVHSRDAVARVPVLSTTTLTKAYGGLLCDLDVTSSKQTADIDTKTKGQFIILPPNDADVAEQMVRIVLNPLFKTGRG